MNGLNRWKLALYLVAIFTAGAVSGWVVATKTARQRAFSPPRTDEIAASLRQRMQAKLDLTEDQQRKVDEIIDRSCAELQSLHRRSLGLIRQAVSNRNAQFAAVLTPDQQKRFEQIEAERQESWRATNAWRSPRPRWHEHGDSLRKDRDRSSGTNNLPTTNRLPDNPDPDESPKATAQPPP